MNEDVQLLDLVIPVACLVNSGQLGNPGLVGALSASADLQEKGAGLSGSGQVWLQTARRNLPGYQTLVKGPTAVGLLWLKWSFCTIFSSRRARMPWASHRSFTETTLMEVRVRVFRKCVRIREST